MDRGLFITFEGGEGAGKTTQIERLAKFIPNAIVTREPGGTPDAEAIRKAFFENNGQNWPPEASVLLMFAARVIHTENLIRPALMSGKTVISDRYTDSTRAYQGYAGNLSPEKIESVKELAIGDFEPDLTFIFDIDPAIGLARAGKRTGELTTFEQKDLVFHEKLRQGYLTIATKYPHRCVVIDASQDVETVAREIQAVVTMRRKNAA